MQTWHPLNPTPPVGRSWGINLGGGTNSTALIIECFNRGFRPNWILFSDTGSERPETYEAILRLRDWCDARKFTSISVTRWERSHPLPNGELVESLEENCLRTGYMPSKAYGYSGCSTKFKIQPAQRWRREHGFADSIYAIGFDAGEEKRVSKTKCKRTLDDAEEVNEEPWYPLYVWGITRARCREIIAIAGLPPVPKSACFFCPNNKKWGWEKLKVDHPDLFDRALAIEARAIKAGNAREAGLTRRNSYLRDLDLTGDWVDPDDLSCACYEPTDG